ncbi:MAG: MoaD/ThiS family protein [Thermoplasmata archaeon]|jgi:MoaD family protein|nr:MoaD/ThiS family protein [Thermoplasmata archaeon]MVT13523.1 MoaD family protein [Euryarchaeota archaeon]MVT14242.1 MoaD family protein [Euryarchaeota archaeon]MVT35923.1 MoaD family protein [Euryarchaeota archaeon]
MKIKVKYFGLYRDLVGKMEESLEGDFYRLSDLISYLEKKYTDFKRDYLVISINYKYVENDENLKDGDEIAIMSPVSGG